jgi:hypothetical protein
MNEQDNVQKNNQPSLIEDLAINNDQAAEVKGGPTATRSTEVAGVVWSGVYDR